MISRRDILEAEQRIRPYIRYTPVIEMERGAFGVQGLLTLKLESLQHAGSFKPRGAFNRILSHQIPSAGVIAASGGNHGAAVAYAAQTLGLPAEIFVPTVSTLPKVEKIRSYGAQLHIGGANYAEALELCLKRQQETGALWVSAYESPETLAGQGTVGKEFDEQAEGLDTVLVAVGGGGLIGGIATWFQNQVQVIAVEPENCPSLYQSQKAGQPTDVKTGGIAADSLGARRVGDLMFEIAQQYIPQVRLVSDEAILEAQQILWKTLQLVAEPGGATALAALISGAYKPSRGERIGVLVCGGNADLSKFA
ncbi:threonine/serine dehydratase [Meiothermus sp.]|uniref:threonine/serine dehydratase n=1 Tax=Meiothermus sp. TaxID=1955249 RepID=UPI00307F3E3E